MIHVIYFLRFYSLDLFSNPDFSKKKSSYILRPSPFSSKLRMHSHFDSSLYFFPISYKNPAHLLYRLGRDTKMSSEKKKTIAANKPTPNDDNCLAFHSPRKKRANTRKNGLKKPSQCVATCSNRTVCYCSKLCPRLVGIRRIKQRTRK